MPQAGPQDWLISAGDPAHYVRATVTVPRLFSDCVSVAETIKTVKKVVNKSSENVSNFRSFGTTLTDDKTGNVHARYYSGAFV
jgi:hypothetical protein